MSTYLAPIEQPEGLMLKLGYRYTRRQFGKVPGPLSVFSRPHALSLHELLRQGRKA